MSALTDTAENLAGDFLNPDVVLPTRPVSPLRLALFTADPGEAPSGTGEVPTAGTAYARQTIALAAAAAGLVTNSAEILFPVAAAAYPGPVTHWGIVDSSGTPRWIYKGAWTVAKTFDVGDQVRIPAGDIDIQFA